MADKLQILNHVRINANSQDAVFERLCSQNIYTPADRARFNGCLYAAPPAGAPCTPEQDVIIAAGGSCYEWHDTKNKAMSGFAAIAAAGLAALVMAKGCVTDSNIHTKQARDIAYAIEDGQNQQAAARHRAITGQNPDWYNAVKKEQTERDASRAAYESTPEEQRPANKTPEHQTNQNYLGNIGILALGIGAIAGMGALAVKLGKYAWK